MHQTSHPRFQFRKPTIPVNPLFRYVQQTTPLLASFSMEGAIAHVEGELENKGIHSCSAIESLYTADIRLYPV